MPHSTNPKHSTRQRRRGVTTLWVILLLPLFLILFCFLVDIANVWHARVELENALEASALAAVKEWGDAGGGPTLPARTVGVNYAGVNTINGTAVVITDNFNGPGGPNQNADCDGNLIFGSITNDMSPYIFNAGIGGGCTPGDVFIEIVKPDAGNDVNVRDIGVFFDDGPATLSIRSIAFTIPILGNNLPQQPYFDSDKEPELSTAVVGADILNRFNATGLDYRGIDPDFNVMRGDWYCQDPPFTPLSGMNTNPDGDVCFEMDDNVPAKIMGSTVTNRYRTLIVNFTDGAFTSTGDPLMTDFFRFGMSINQMNPPALAPPMSQNNGEAWHIAPMAVSVTFYNSATMMTQTASTVFVDDGDPDNDRSIANLSGSGGGQPAVRAQATVAVPSLCCSFCGINFGPYSITAKATAMYDCGTGRMKLIRVEPQNFFCPGP